MKFSKYDDIDRQYHKKLQAACPLNTYRVFNTNEIPIPLPKSLLEKSFKAVVVSSGDSSGGVYMINMLRSDESNNAVDQEPLIIAYQGKDNEFSLIAGFVHHGDWKGRTMYPEAGFFQAIAASGITEYYPYVGVPPKECGSITELQPDSHKQAFWNCVKLIRGDEQNK